MFHRTMLYISSYIPLYLLMISKNILERTTQEGNFIIKNIITIKEGSITFNKDIVLFDEINDYALLFLSLLTIISLVYLVITIKKTDCDKKYKVVSFSNETVNNFFNYISIYLLSCMGLTLNSIVDVFILFFLMILLGYIYVTNNIIYLNPVLNFMKYKIYVMTLKSDSTQQDIESIVIIKSKKKIKKGMSISGTEKSEFIIAECKDE
jgi:hypothetical protein